LKTRLYTWLAADNNYKQVYFSDFLTKFAFVIWNSPNAEKMKFVFFMLDWDNDGILSAYDLLRTTEYIAEESKFGQELQILINHFVDTHLTIKAKPNPINVLQFTKFM
jgi:Ca2+-binding EF-hand superfamily protein